MASTNQPHRQGNEIIPPSSQYSVTYGLQDSIAINAKIGGQYGWSPNNYFYILEQPYVQQQGVFITLSTPGMFSRIPGAYDCHGIIKSMMENRTISFDGLTIQTEVDFIDQEMPGGRVLSTPIDAKRSLGTPTHKVNELQGEPFDKVLNTWIFYGAADPDLKVSRLVLLDNPGDMLLDDRTMSGIYFEPNHNYTDIAHACLALAMFPTRSAQREIKRNKQDTFGIREMDIEFKALLEHDTYSVKEIARTMFKQMSFYNHAGTSAPTGFTDRTQILKTEIDAGIIEQMMDRAAQVVSKDYINT